MVGLLGCGCCDGGGFGCPCNPSYSGEFNFAFDSLPSELVTISGTDANLRAESGQLRNTLAKNTNLRVGVRSSFQNLTLGQVGCYRQYDLEVDFELLTATWLPAGLGQHSITLGLWQTANTAATAYLQLFQTPSGIGIAWYAPNLTAGPSLPRIYTHSSLTGTFRIKCSQQSAGSALWDWTGYIDGVALPHTSSGGPPFTFGSECDFYAWLFHSNDIAFPVQLSNARFDNFTQTFTAQ